MIGFGGGDATDQHRSKKGGERSSHEAQPEFRGL